MQCTPPAPPPSQTGGHIAEAQYYAKTLVGDSQSCSCHPCGAKQLGTIDASGKSHNGYWSFMGDPGNECAPSTAAASDRCPGHRSFARVARQHLRGMRVLLIGDSVTTQIFFAALCDLRSHGLLDGANVSRHSEHPTGSWRTPEVPLTFAPSRGTVDECSIAYRGGGRRWGGVSRGRASGGGERFLLSFLFRSSICFACVRLGCGRHRGRAAL